MKTINLFFDFEFTSLSPDAQIISLGIISDEVAFRFPNPEPKTVTMDDRIPIYKSFYSEFSDFDINRCDDWVKENVVSKLKFYGKGDKLRCSNEYDGNSWDGFNDTVEIKRGLKEYLSQFSGYQIQFVTDCGTFDWYWLLQLLAEWDLKRVELCNGFMTTGYLAKTGLPKLPANISPVPFDLNDLIAIKKGITPMEAFNLDRDELFFASCDKSRTMPLPDHTRKFIAAHVPDKHNSLSDANVIKGIYNNLK